MTLQLLIFYKDLLPFVPFEEEMLEKLDQLFVAEEDGLTAIAETYHDLAIPLGNYRAISTFSSIQNDLPETYQVGQK